MQAQKRLTGKIIFTVLEDSIKKEGHMNPKLKKVNAEIDKMEARLAETQEALKNLRAEKKMLEDLEIVKAGKRKALLFLCRKTNNL